MSCWKSELGHGIAFLCRPGEGARLPMSAAAAMKEVNQDKVLLSLASEIEHEES